MRDESGTDPFPRVIWPEFSFAVARTDENRDEVDAIIDTVNENIGRTQMVYVYLTTGGTCTEDDEIFRGTVVEDGI